jgi:xanthine/CO dehydrogenase XdhC/CoxF family maturation factor
VKEICNIIQVYESLDHSREKVALASVVSVEESSYRRIGARMLVQSSGVWVGGISGGCLEGDALRRSQAAIYKNQPSLVVYDTMEDDRNQIGVGLGCNGRIEVLLTPIDPEDPNNEIELLKKIQHDNKPNILLKVIDAPANAGILGQVQLHEMDAATPSFAEIEADELAGYIEEVSSRKSPKTFSCDTSAYGRVKILIEFIRPETRLVIAGDNYDVNALVHVATALGWDIFVIGKAKKLSRQVFEQAKRVLDYNQTDELDINEYTAVVLMTHDYQKDLELLPLFYARQPAYLGLLGPKKRFLKMKNELPDIPFDESGFLFTPTGLEIGAESPQEIALSIAAEIVAAMRRRQGSSLRLKEGTIHERG